MRYVLPNTVQFAVIVPGGYASSFVGVMLAHSFA